VVFGLFSICDLLLSWILPGTYGESVVKVIGNGFGDLDAYVDAAMSDSDSLLVVTPASLSLAGWLGWCTAVLPFGLGAICFKKAKVAKTLLCVFALGMVLSTLLAILLGSGNLDASWFMDRFSTPAQAATAINWYLNITCFGTLALLLGGIFYRLRTIQH
jgi:hypothetical protein